jgi:OOP family OmpA-OmpF porin
MKRKFIGAACALFGVIAIVAPSHGQSFKLFGPQYRPVLQASPDQVQIVYYRAGHPTTTSKGPAANLYIDGEFHTGLLPGGYTAFCVTPGDHHLGVWYKEGPQFAGKHSQQGAVELEAGKTYFIDAGHADSSGKLIPVSLEVGENELADNRLQSHVISRASAVVKCTNRFGGYVVTADKSGGLTYALPLDVLFEYARSDRNGMTPEGREAIARLAKELAGNQGELLVTGHADLIGSDAAAQATARARAETVRQMLVEAGVIKVQARSAGNTEPMNGKCGKTNSASNIRCNAPNRRVHIELR